MDSKIHKLPNADLGISIPQDDLIRHLEEALEFAKSGEAIAGATALVLKRPDGIYYWNTHHQAPGLSSELYFAISRLKARFSAALEFFNASA